MVAIFTPAVVVIINNNTRRREQEIRDKDDRNKVEESTKQPLDKSDEVRK